jgi:transposase
VIEEQREVKRKKRVIEDAEWSGDIKQTCLRFGIARSTFYCWRDRFRESGDRGLTRHWNVPHNHPKKTPKEVVEKILHLRRTRRMGPIRIAWSLERYHGSKTSDAIVYRVCKRHGIYRLPNRLPDCAAGRAFHTHRYEKQLPGHPVEVDVKFLTLKRKRAGPMRRYPYTAIDDATRVRALKIYKRHTQANAIDFIDTVVDKFPFRIQTIRTDRGHEFQALPLACRGQWYETCLHQAKHATARWEGRALPPNLQG